MLCLFSPLYLCHIPAETQKNVLKKYTTSKQIINLKVATKLYF